MTFIASCLKVIRRPWPSCFRALCSDDQGYEKMFGNGCYMTEDNAQMSTDGSFQLLGRRDNIVLMSTAEKQVFMIHREQLGGIYGNAFKKAYPDEPFNRAVMVMN